MSTFETIYVSSLDVACDGGGGAQNLDKSLGHPKVYLHIDAEKAAITCPYCSKTYALKALSGAKAGAH